MNRLLALVATIGLAIAGLAAVPDTPAAASLCWLNSATNPSTGRPHQLLHYDTYPNGATAALRVHKGGCMIVGPVGTPGRFRFRVQVQDTIDTCNVGCVNDHTSYSGVEWRTPGGTWQPIVQDFNSADFNYNQTLWGQTWYSPWFNYNLHGHPANFQFRYHGTSNDGTNNPSRNWHTWGTPVSSDL